MSTLLETTEPDRLFGRIAVEQGWITAEQLVEAVRIQSREEWRRRLGEIFLDLGWIDSTQLLAILDEQRRRGANGRATRPAAPAPTSAATTASPSGSAPLNLSSLDALLRQVVARGASDLHLHSGSRARVRVDGALHDLSPSPLEQQQIAALLEQVLPPAHQARLEAEGQVDFMHALPEVGRFRGNAYRQQRGIDVVLRAVPPEPPTLQGLGLPAELARLTHHHQGLVLVTGPSGCGKTSTLAALVNLINQEREVHILTAEEPIEFRQPSRRALVNQREIGTHSDSYARVLRGAFREDPDVIALGDLRDHATISLALTAAETGHLVMATMHTGGAIRTINRLIGAFPPNEQDQARVMISESLRAIVTQRLVPRKDGGGRVAALEILIATRAVSNLVRERKTFQIESVMQLGAGDGMCTLEQSLDRLVAAGVVTREDAARHRAESYIVAGTGGASHARA
ncbi:MAG TPA: PilT/PilU family type 4a pilus ATPase [Thermoanaerobaculia bacterium]|nr:PilT/PilU family type 4a pilus ATPase [Thermoanaerobaculia bacterium]